MSGEKRDWKREMLAERETLRARVAELETRFFNLERDRDAQRERAERAEKERAEWEQAYNRGLAKERTRREQAERERDESRKEYADAVPVWKSRLDYEKAARERAEADNAAKDEAFGRYVEMHGVEHETGCPEDSTCECPLVVALNRAFGPDHPGAALLEELRALRKVRDVLRDVEWQRTDWQGFCVFRRAVGCDATDGVRSGMGTPTPRPHVERCPFHALAADALRGKG